MADPTKLPTIHVGGDVINRSKTQQKPSSKFAQPGPGSDDTAKASPKPGVTVKAKHVKAEKVHAYQHVIYSKPGKDKNKHGKTVAYGSLEFADGELHFKDDSGSKYKIHMSETRGPTQVDNANAISDDKSDTTPRQSNPPGSGRAGPSNIGDTGQGSRAAQAMNYFQSQGWSKAQAAGIVGNLQAESGKNLATNLSGDNGQAYGVAQWHPDRQANFQRVMGVNVRQASFAQQLSFVNYELNHSESKAGGILRSATDARSAASLFDQYYERSSGAARGSRMNNASSLMGENTANAGTPDNTPGAGSDYGSGATPEGQRGTCISGSGASGDGTSSNYQAPVSQPSTLPGLPPDTMDLQKAMENMNPAGLVGQIQELTKLTKEINNITTTIAQNLPGAPYSFITLAAQLVKQLGTVGNGLTGILGQLDPSVEHILESNIKLPDMSAMTDQINKVMSALTPEQFLNNLPGSLSPDGLIASIAKSDPTLMAGLQSVTGQLQNAQGAYDQASSAVTGMVSPQNAIDIPLPPSRPIDLGTTVPLPPSRPANLGTITDTGTPTSSGIVAASVPASSGIVAASVNPTIATVATYDAPINDQIQLEAVDTPVISTFVDEPVSVEPIPIPLEDLGRINVTIDLDSDITDDVWNSLLEYTQAITSPNSQEKAWFIKTIINRSKKTGLGILETLSQFSENLVINAVSPEDKEAIGNSIIEWFSGIPKNNYFFDPIKDGALDTQPPKRKGVTGIRIGDCFVYPGARWP